MPMSVRVTIWKPILVNWSWRSFWIKISSNLSSSPSLFPGHYLNMTSLIMTHQLWPTNYNNLTNYLSVINLLLRWIYKVSNFSPIKAKTCAITCAIANSLLVWLEPSKFPLNLIKPLAWLSKSICRIDAARVSNHENLCRL